jgi:head-tail adaptor
VWQSVATLRAKVEPVRAMEVLRSGQDVSQTYITVTLRFHALIKASMRLRTQNGTYIIQGVENVLNRDRVLKLMCLQVGDTE